MRWDRLFGDLESRFDHELGAEVAVEAVDEARARAAAVSLRDRLLAAAGTAVVRTGAGATLRLRIAAVGGDWLAGREHAGGTVLVPLSAVQWLRLEPDAWRRPADRPTATFALALRDLARRRTPVEVALADDRPTGTIDGVGADHLDLAVHPVELPRRDSAVTAVWLVPLRRIDRVRWSD